MSTYKKSPSLDDIDVVSDLENDTEAKEPGVASKKSTDKYDSASVWKIQENASSIMSQTVTSVTAALGKQFENLSRQSTLDSYGFSGRPEPSSSSTLEAPKFTVDDSNVDKTSISKDLPFPDNSSILHDKLYEKNLILRRNIEYIVNDSYSGLLSKLDDILNLSSKIQLYFQESVISMQNARDNSNELILCLDKMCETTKINSAFKRNMKKAFCDKHSAEDC